MVDETDGPDPNQIRRHGMRQKQMGVSLPPDLRAKLEAAASAAGISLAEEIRRRLWLSFIDGVDPSRHQYAESIFIANEYWLNQ